MTRTLEEEDEDHACCVTWQASGVGAAVYWLVAPHFDPRAELLPVSYRSEAASAALDGYATSAFCEPVPRADPTMVLLGRS